MASSVLHVPPDPSRPLLTRNRVVGFSVAMLVLAGLTLLIWPEALSSITKRSYLPHSYCYLQQPRLVWLHVFSDTMIALAYVAISFMLGVLVHRARRDIPFSWVFIAFGLFIVSCGGTHFMEVITVWTPLYWLSGDIKLITAVASVATAVAMPPLIPRTLKLVQEAKVANERKRSLEQAHTELESLFSRLRDYDQVKTRFFANVSHDLRTPLTLILGPTEKLLRSHGLTEVERKNLETIQHNARLLLVHVNDLLDVSRLDAGKLDPMYQATDLARTVRFSSSFFDSLATDKKINFKLELPEALPAEIDSDKIQRVILNLLTNAFRFTPESGTVRLTLSERQGKGIIEVADSGPGIPQDMRKAVFDRYRQLPQDTNRANRGSGLGLAIVQDFVNLHLGTITVSDAPEGGALFRIELPLRAPKNARFAKVDVASQAQIASAVVEEARPEAVEEVQENVDSSKAKVLIVEDNSDMRNFMVASLSRDYQAVSARNGREGLEKARTENPDLVISDIMMPEMTGDQLVHEFQRDPELASIPVILISARADDSTRISLLRKGVQDYMVKPFSGDELLARVGNLVTTKRVRDLLRRELASRSSSVEQLAEEIAARNRELQAALEELRRSEVRFRRLSESGVIGVIRADTRGNLFDANDAFLSMLGYTRDELNAGKIRWNEITPAEWDEADRLAADHLLRTGRIIPFEKEYLHKDGHRVPVLIGAAMVDRASEEALVLVLDLTERKRAELALRNSEKLATIGRLAGTIAHEINNPLDAVNNLLFLIQNDPELSPNSRNFVRLATDEMARIIQICRQMLGFYRESNTPVEVEIDSVLSNVVSLYQRKIRLFNTQVESQLRFEAAIRGFPGEMRQLFSNLFVNALEAAGQNGRVRLRSRLTRDWRNPERVGVRVIVHDNGPGIEPGLFANIFEPFFTTKGEKGTGLGLWVSRGIVEKHGGYLRVRTSTRAGQSGTCFSVFLPLDPSVAASAPDEIRLPA